MKNKEDDLNEGYLTPWWIVKTILRRLIIVVPIIFCILATIHYWQMDNTTCTIDNGILQEEIHYWELQHTIPTEYRFFNFLKTYYKTDNIHINCTLNLPQRKGTITAVPDYYKEPWKLQPTEKWDLGNLTPMNIT